MSNAEFFHWLRGFAMGFVAFRILMHLGYTASDVWLLTLACASVLVASGLSHMTKPPKE